MPLSFNSCKARDGVLTWAAREVKGAPRPKVNDRNIDRHSILDMLYQTCCFRERNAPVATPVTEDNVSVQQRAEVVRKFRAVTAHARIGGWAHESMAATMLLRCENRCDDRIL